jgi:hypothetical protein
MILTLASTLDVPLRDQNVLLRAAGFAEAFAEPRLDAEIDPPIANALERMLAQHEPFPMIVVNGGYDVLRINQAGSRILACFIDDPSAMELPLNAFHLLFNPRLARPFVVNWERTARGLLSRLHREALHKKSDHTLTSLIDSLLAYPGVPPSFRQPDFSAPSGAVFHLRMRRDDLTLAFLSTVTSFSAPQDITLEELRIESYFPLDDATEAACARLAGADSRRPA